MSFFSLLFLSLFTQAYLLEYSTIMSRTAANHGNGGYQIQQVIRWEIDDVPMEILETWTVRSESQMHLRLEGLGRLKNRVQGEIVYDSQKKLVKNANGQTITQRLPATFSPAFFHFRSSRWMKERLVSLQMAPPESLQDRPPLPLTDNPSYQPQNFVSLQRVGGTITFGIGDHEKPYLYIEQDQFVVTQIQFPRGPSVLAESYKDFPAKLQYPQSMTYTFEKNKAKMTLRKVSYLGRSPKAEAFRFSKEASEVVLPNESVIQEFYNTFR